MIFSHRPFWAHACDALQISEHFVACDFYRRRCLFMNRGPHVAPPRDFAHEHMFVGETPWEHQLQHHQGVLPTNMCSWAKSLGGARCRWERAGHNHFPGTSAAQQQQIEYHTPGDPTGVGGLHKQDLQAIYPIRHCL